MVECFFFVQDQLPASVDKIIIDITGIATCARSKAPERVVEATPGPPATPHSPLKGGRRSELGAAESHTTYAGLRGGHGRQHCYPCFRWERNKGDPKTLGFRPEGSKTRGDSKKFQ